jgi:hypothetical protein
MKPLGEHLGFWTYTPIPDDPPVEYPEDPSDRDDFGSWDRVFGRGADDEGCNTTQGPNARVPWLSLAAVALFSVWRIARRSRALPRR